MTVPPATLAVTFALACGGSAPPPAEPTSEPASEPAAVAAPLEEPQPEPAIATTPLEPQPPQDERPATGPTISTPQPEPTSANVMAMVRARMASLRRCYEQHLRRGADADPDERDACLCARICQWTMPEASDATFAFPQPDGRRMHVRYGPEGEAEACGWGVGEAPAQLSDCPPRDPT